MQRRRFLTLAALMPALPLVARAATDLAHIDHASMGHGPAAGPHAGIDHSTMGQAAPAVALPEGAPLPALVPLANRSREAGRFSGELVAAPVHKGLAEHGKPTEVWAYNGSLPGPLIEAYEGDTVEIAFTNRLPQPTTVHWHGLPVPADQDGNPAYPVLPGETRHYRFSLPSGSAGSYWYHPHPHGHTAEQVFRGLAGVFVVKSRRDPLAHLRDIPLVLSDLRLDADAAIPANTKADWMDGREGDYVLVNGALKPVLALGENERVRLRVYNATSARVLRLALPGFEVWRVGSDGGLIEAPRREAEVLLSPGERAELVITGAAKAGRLIALPYQRGKMMSAEVGETLVLATVAPGPRVASVPLPKRLRRIAALPAPKVKRRVVLEENMADPKAMFTINGKTFDMNRADFVGRVGEVEEWEVINRADMDHPFHLHGTQFQVAARHDGRGWKTEPYRAWRDVVSLPAGQAVKLRFRQDQPGMRMFHCHILEHEDQGMMGQIDVRA
ncbi:multicopper oxidase family protein [Crenobacter cavernae]|uniref:Multicopper oxidase family protein n=1 Tax=Crenobacter cavernae TaxID=2290923 RepID=A0ABY0FFJ5_9NEIS|nr:multicopper oxidase family protein [Crenobacter cavernae]RXZ43388.1 multicopper oxidase family protein [Crenobacter cavernae]